LLKLIYFNKLKTLRERNNLDFFATQSVEMDSMVLDQYVGKAALQISQIKVLIV
jgi:hypothetical protein